MKQITNQKPSCCCTEKPVEKTEAPTKKRSILQIIKSSLLAVLIVFFPKCPLCWAAYMSLFGSVGLSNLPYMPWLMPVLMTLLMVHLYIMYKKTADSGHIAFYVSALGAAIIMISRFMIDGDSTLIYIGLATIIVGTVMNNFKVDLSRLTIFNYNSN